jgi:hypothetical protein
VSDIGEEIKRRLLALPSGKSADLAGVSDEEISDLERYAGGRLPLVYKQFLRHLGRSAGELFRGTDHSFRQRDLRWKLEAEEIIARSQAPFLLSPSAFVFLMAQGYQFSFFHIDQGDDPSVHHYLEGASQPTLLDELLSGYLMRCIEDCELRELGRQVTKG